MPAIKVVDLPDLANNGGRQRKMLMNGPRFHTWINVYLPGEMLLIQAEAQARLRNVPQAVQLLDQLRARTGSAWQPGAGWAGAACPGVVFGINLTGHLTADVQADAVLYQASLTSADDTEVLGG